MAEKITDEQIAQIKRQVDHFAATIEKAQPDTSPEEAYWLAKEFVIQCWAHLGPQVGMETA